MNDNSNRPLSETIIEVRKLSQANLARYSRLDPTHCKEVYLFQNDQFCGIRFSLGPFLAHWLIDQTEIKFCREDTEIGHVELGEPTKKLVA